MLHRLQRLQKICSPVRSWESEAAAVLAELLGRSIRDNNRPAWPDAFLGIFISHTFSIYKIALQAES